MFFVPAPDVEDISRVLADMPDWKELADSLNIRSSDVETNCAQDVSQPSCYRRDLVRRYCDSQQSGDPSKVAEDIAQSLRKMKYEPQAQQLRNLGFGKLVAKHSNPRGLPPIILSHYFAYQRISCSNKM